MKTITLNLPDDVYESAAETAAAQHVSVEQLLTDIVCSQPRRASPEEFERLKKLQDDLFAKADRARFSAADRLSREALHERHVEDEHAEASVSDEEHARYVAELDALYERTKKYHFSASQRLSREELYAEMLR
jgi:hypothetical protein